ncbi:Zinc finger protein [Plecturocebus cupreus]
MLSTAAGVPSDFFPSGVPGGGRALEICFAGLHGSFDFLWHNQTRAHISKHVLHNENRITTLSKQHRVLLSCPGWSAVAQCQLTATLNLWAQAIIFFFFETESRSVAQAGGQWHNLDSLQSQRQGFTMLARLVSNSRSHDLPAFASQSAGITSVSHHARPQAIILLQPSKYRCMPPRLANLFSLIESLSIAQAGVQWRNLGSLQPPPPRFYGALTLHSQTTEKQSSLNRFPGFLLESARIAKRVSGQGSVHVDGVNSAGPFGSSIMDTKGQVFVCFLRRGLVLSPRLQSSGVITAHCSLCLLGSRGPLASASRVAVSTDMHHHSWITFAFFVETGFHHIAQGGPKLLGSSDPPALASQSARITDVNHRA